MKDRTPVAVRLKNIKQCFVKSLSLKYLDSIGVYARVTSTGESFLKCLFRRNIQIDFRDATI